MVVEKIGTSGLKVPRNSSCITSPRTTDPCVTCVAYSNSGQPKLQLRGVQIPPPPRNHRGGVGWRVEGCHHRPRPTGGGGGAGAFVSKKRCRAAASVAPVVSRPRPAPTQTKMTVMNAEGNDADVLLACGIPSVTVDSTTAFMLFCPQVPHVLCFCLSQ